MICVTPVDTTTVNGLANILTSSETIVVNSVVGSVLTESSAKRSARTILKTVHAITGTKATRCVYRLMEWALDNKFVSESVI